MEVGPRLVDGNATSAQTERSGLSRPVRSVLGGQTSPAEFVSFGSSQIQLAPTGDARPSAPASFYQVTWMVMVTKSDGSLMSVIVIVCVPVVRRMKVPCQFWGVSSLGSVAFGSELVKWKVSVVLVAFP